MKDLSCFGRQKMRIRRVVVKSTNSGQEVTVDSLNGFRISFNISKNLSSTPNQAALNIFNVQSKKMEFMSTFGNKVSISAGYNDDLSLIYCGTVRAGGVRRVGADLVANINLQTGFTDNDKQYSEYFDMNQDLSGIIKDIATKSKIKIVNENIIVNGTTGFRGISLIGTCKTILDDLAKTYSFSWSNQDGYLLALDDNEYVKSSILSESSSIISVSQISENKIDNGLGVKVITQLNPGVKIGNGFEFDSYLNPALSKVIYKVYKISHIGDTHTNNWTTAITGFKAGFSYFKKEDTNSKTYLPPIQ